jgi:hypothetical protein
MDITYVIQRPNGRKVVANVEGGLIGMMRSLSAEALAAKYAKHDGFFEAPRPQPEPAGPDTMPPAASEEAQPAPELPKIVVQAPCHCAYRAGGFPGSRVPPGVQESGTNDPMSACA